MGFGQSLDREHQFDVAAAKLRKNGWTPIPIAERQKGCYVKDWQTHKFGKSEDSKYKGFGVGIRTRDTPAIDVDVRDATVCKLLVAAARAVLGDGPERIGMKPKTLLPFRLSGKAFEKKYTRLFVLPGDKPGDAPHRVEILGNGQQFVAFNIHSKTRKPYIWRGGSPLTTSVDQLPTMTAAQADTLIKRFDAILSKHGKPSGSIKPAETKPIRRNREDTLTASDPALLRDALASIKNDDVDYDEWFHVGMAIKGALGDDGHDDFSAWSEKSAKHDEKNFEKEWRGFKPTSIGAGSIFHRAEKAGWKRPKPPTPDKATAPDTREAADSPYVLSEHIESVSKMLQREIDPVEYLFDDMLAVGACSILAGPPKGFKSSLALYLSLVAVGAIKSDWSHFKRTDTRRLRVGYLDLEQADPLFMERLAEFEPDESAVKRLFRVDQFPKFDADGIKFLEQFILEKRLDALFVDTIARVRTPGRGRSASDIDAELLHPVTQLAHRTRCHIGVLAHNGKRKDFDNPIDMIASTAALAGAVDDVMVIFKPQTAEHELRRNLFVTGRHVRSPGVYVIDRTQGGFNFIGEATDVLEGALQKGVLAVLNSSPVAMTPSAIAKELGKQRLSIQKVLPKLMDRRVIVNPEAGKYQSIDSAIKNKKR